jgi:hypothetical protein
LVEDFTGSVSHSEAGNISLLEHNSGTRVTSCTLHDKLMLHVHLSKVGLVAVQYMLQTGQRHAIIASHARSDIDRASAKPVPFDHVIRMRVRAALQLRMQEVHICARIPY